MQMNKIERIKELINQLNRWRYEYYTLDSPTVDDYTYDSFFDELSKLEKENGIYMSNSPTQTVGYEIKSELEKVKHTHMMLSLDKTKSIEDLESFKNNKDCLLMCKMDGLTVLLTYENGDLVQAETRGNGEYGELITHNARVFENIPLHIKIKERIEFEGEAIITYEDFENINSTLPQDKKYKNPRNLASGSVRQLDSSIAEKRHIRFILWKVPGETESMTKALEKAEKLGFEIVPHILVYSWERSYNEYIDGLKLIAEQKGYPIDGLVMSYNDIQYGKALGTTGHHPKHSIAYKFYDEEVETELVNIEWTMGKTGTLTPVAVFKPIELEGTTVERASLHNISVMNELTKGVDWYKGMKLLVYKANQIIPQIRSVIIDTDKKNKKNVNDIFLIPYTCPICGGKTIRKKDFDSEILICTNPNCQGKLLGCLCNFVSKKAHDIKGLSESTLQALIEKEYLKSSADLYYLKDKEAELSTISGFGAKSVKKMIDAIEKSRQTSLSKFLVGLNIPLIGASASKEIEKYEEQKAREKGFDTAWECFMADIDNSFNWTTLEGFGENMNKSIVDYFDVNMHSIIELSKEFVFENVKKETKEQEQTLAGRTFVITGSLEHFANRNELKTKIEESGGKVTASVTKKTDFLINNDRESSSSKNKKAKELGIEILTEEEFLKMIMK